MQIITWLLSLQNQESEPMSPDRFLLWGWGRGLGTRLASIGQKWGGSLYTGALHFRVTTITDCWMPRGHAISLLSLAVWWAKLEKLASKAQIASLLAVATVFIGLCTLIPTFYSQGGGGLVRETNYLRRNLTTRTRNIAQKCWKPASGHIHVLWWYPVCTCFCNYWTYYRSIADILTMFLLFYFRSRSPCLCDGYIEHSHTSFG